MKEFHIHFRDYPENTVHTIKEVEQLLVCKAEEIHTTQLCEVSTRLFEAGYKIIVHPYIGDVFEIKLGENTHTERLIKEGHNIAKLLYSGEFDSNGVFCVM